MTTIAKASELFAESLNIYFSSWNAVPHDFFGGNVVGLPIKENQMTTLPTGIERRKFSAKNTATELVKIALQSGSIKLSGNEMANRDSHNAKSDALYLSTLIANLTIAIQEV